MSPSTPARRSIAAIENKIASHFSKLQIQCGVENNSHSPSRAWDDSWASWAFLSFKRSAKLGRLSRAMGSEPNAHPALSTAATVNGMRVRAFALELGPEWEAVRATAMLSSRAWRRADAWKLEEAKLRADAARLDESVERANA